MSFRRALVCALVVTFVAQAVTPVAATAAQKASSVRETTPIGLSVAAATGELADRRTEKSRTIRNADGSLTASLFTAPVNYRTSDGNWAPISTKLVSARQSGYAWQNEAGGFRAAFKADLGSEHLRFEIGGAAFAVSLEGAQPARGAVTNNEIRYPGALRSVDLSYDVIGEGIKERIILLDRRAPNTLWFRLHPLQRTPLNASLLRDGTYAFTLGPGGQTLFGLLAPFAVESGALNEGRPDSNAHTSMTVTRDGDDYLINVTVDSAWLGSADRRFPITIDPTLSLQPSSQDASFPFQCTGCTARLDDHLYIGNDTVNSWRSALQFDMNAVPAGATITDAQLRLYWENWWCLYPVGTQPCNDRSHQMDAYRMTAAWNTATTTVAQLQYDTPSVLASATLQIAQPAGWLSWSVTPTVQNWYSGAQANYGLLLRNSSEVNGQGGPGLPSRRNANSANWPKLDVTYTSDGVWLDAPSVVHSNGADLHWSKYAGGASFDRYEIHRSKTPNFTPSASTLLTTIRDISVTSYRDTSAAPDRSFTYEVAANAVGSNERTVSLPGAGLAVRTYLLTPADEATYIQYRDGGVNCWNYGSLAFMYLGGNDDGGFLDRYRSLVRFDVRDIPVGAPVTAATLSLFQPNNPSNTGTVQVYRATHDWAEGTGPTCTGDGATWYDADAAVPWAALGADYDSTLVTSVTKSTAGNKWDVFDVVTAVQTWVNGSAPNDGLLLRLADETMAANNWIWYSTDDEPDAALRPKVNVTYQDGSVSQVPTAAVATPGAGQTVRGTVAFSAAAADDRRVDLVEFLVNGAVIGSSSVAPFSVSWNTTGLSGSKTLSVRATDDAGNVTTSQPLVVTVDNSAAPTTNITAPANNASVSGNVTVSANAADDVGVSMVEFFLDGTRIGNELTSAPYTITWNTLNPAQPAYDGIHELTSRAYDGGGQVTISAPITVTVNNIASTKYKGAITLGTGSTYPQAVTFDPAAGTQEKSGFTVNLANNSSTTWTASSIKLHYRWYSPDAPALETAAPGASQTVIDSAAISIGANLAAGNSRNVTVQADPPTLPAGVDQARYRLQFDLYDSAASTWFATKGNAPLENPVIVNKKLKTALGIERYYHYEGQSLGAGMISLVNVANGNSIVRWSPWNSPGRGLSTVLDLTYNSLEKKSSSPIGNNWSLSISSLTRFGQPIDIHPNNADTIAGRSNKYISFTDGDGTTFRFDASTFDPTVYQEPAGVHLYLRVSPEPTKGAWAITRPDRVTFYYDSEGYPTRVEDANGNAITFTLQTTPPGEDPGGPKKRVTEVVDPAGQGGSPAPNRKYVISYYSKDDTKKPQIRGKIKDITDHSGARLHFDYYEDGNVLRIVQGGGLNADGTTLADRSFVFTYMTPDGSAPAIPDAPTPPYDINRQSPNPKTNQSTAMYSMRDARGGETKFSYYGPTSGQLRWKLNQLTDRSAQITGYSYDLVAQQTTVTAPLSRVSKFTYDADGKVTRYLDPLNQQTDIGWSTDFAPISITEPGTPARVTQYAYNSNGYLTQQVDQLGNTTLLEYQSLAADAKDVIGAWKTGRTVAHLSQLIKKTDPKGVATPTPTDDYQWLFEYDPKGNLTKVTDPEDAVTSFSYNTDGTLATNTDANLKQTQFQTYDNNGLATRIVDAKGQSTQLGYNDDGLLLWLQDPLHASDIGANAQDYRSYFDYDAFRRLGRRSMPKSTSTERSVLLWTAAQFDPNDNVIAEIAPQYGAQYNGTGARTNMTYDAMDRRLQITGPDTAADPLGERTGIQYDAAGRVTRVTQPKGTQTSITANDFATFYSYDALDRIVSEKQHAVDGSGNITDTRTTYLCYSVPGDLISVTAPNANLQSAPDCASTTTPYTTRYAYDLAHRRTSITDALAHVQSVTYDANGNVATTTDAASVVTTRGYDQRNLLTSTIEPLDTGRTLTTKMVHDPVGNLKKVISPRAYDDSADKISFPNYVTTYQYDNVNQLIRVDLAVGPAPDTTQLYVHRGYNANGDLAFHSLPVNFIDPAQLTADQKTAVDYFDTSWIRASRDPGNPRVHFDYTAEGWQSSRVPEGTAGTLDLSHKSIWTYFVDGMLKEQADIGGQKTTFNYDANNQLISATDASGLVTSATPLTVQTSYSAFNEVSKSRQKLSSDADWGFSVFAYDRNGNVIQREENGVETDPGVLVTAARKLQLFYDQADWLASQQDDNATAADTSDDQQILNVFTATGREQQRTIQSRSGGSWTNTQLTNWTYFQNGKLKTLTITNGASTVLESHTLGYETAGRYLNGHRAADVFTLAGPDVSAPCRTTSCTATFSYDARDRLRSATDGHGGTYTYALDDAGNITAATDPTGTKTMTYTGNQLATLTVGGSTAKYWYDPNGNLGCITLATGTEADCPVATGGTASAQLLADYSYDYLDRLASFHSYTTNGTTSTPKDSATYGYDPLSRPTQQTSTRGVGAPTTTFFTYLGLSSRLSQEQQKDQAGAVQVTKTYGYDAAGHRVSMTNTPAGSSTERFTYGTDPRSSVSLLIDAAGSARAAYGYGPYGDADTALTKGDADPASVLNPYRFQSKRSDVISGTLDMGARRFGVDLGRFLQQDLYQGAGRNLQLSLDPLTQNRYAFAGGNPVSFVETDGHAFSLGDGGCAGGTAPYWCNEPPPPAVEPQPTPTPQPGPAPAKAPPGSGPSGDDALLLGSYVVEGAGASAGLLGAATQAASTTGRVLANQRWHPGTQPAEWISAAAGRLYPWGSVTKALRPWIARAGFAFAGLGFVLNTAYYAQYEPIELAATRAGIETIGSVVVGTLLVVAVCGAGGVVTGGVLLAACIIGAGAVGGIAGGFTAGKLAEIKLGPAPP